MYCITITGPKCGIFTTAELKQFKGNTSGNYNSSSYVRRITEYDDTKYTIHSIKSIEIVDTSQIVYNISVQDDESYLITYDNLAVHNCKHLTAVLSNKRWLQQVTSTFMNWLEKNIDGVNKYLGLKGDKVLTLPNELARQNAKLSWQKRRETNIDDNTNIETPENNEENQENITNNVKDNNPSTNAYNNIDNQTIDTENDENNNE